MIKRKLYLVCIATLFLFIVENFLGNSFSIVNGQTVQSERVFSKHFKVTSPLWNKKIRDVIVNYIPMTIKLLESDKSGWHSLAVFEEAGKKIKGKPYELPIKNISEMHAWGDATVLNTFEAMCWALTIDAQGDSEIVKTQNYIRDKLKVWTPLLTDLIKPDGYFSPQGTLIDYPYFESPKELNLHLGYLLGYLLDCGLALYIATDGKDKSVYMAGKKTIDLWCETLGHSPKKPFTTFHPGIKQSLVKFGDFVEKVDGKGTAKKYYQLAQFLCDTRGNNGGEGYVMSDKSNIDAPYLYGHAVCAVYLLSGMAETTRSLAKTNADDSENYDKEFKIHDASITSKWENLVNCKMYVNGSIGSSMNEALSDDFDLPNYSYGESCAAIGHMFVQNNFALLYGNAKYHDILEVTLYNAFLGSLDNDANNWCYCNPLTNVKGNNSWGNWKRRNYQEDCCMNNIGRVILQLPTFMYSRGKNSLHINQFIGSTFVIDDIAGTDVEIIQTTSYPQNGNISIVVNPKTDTSFKLHIRIPNRQISRLYQPDLNVEGYSVFKLNGKDIKPSINNGYAVIDRKWKKGDKIELILPMKLQTITAIPNVKEDKGKIAFQYGPIIFAIESVDIDGKNPVQVAIDAKKPLKAEYKKDFLGGVWTVKGFLSDNSPFRAIPFYARLNRDIETEYSVWINKQ